MIDKFTIKELLSFLIIMGAFNLSGIIILYNCLKHHVQGNHNGNRNS